MLKSLALFAALAFGCAVTANAIPISGSLGITGANDTWSSTTVFFSSPGMVNVATGTFASTPIGTPVFLDNFTYLPANFAPNAYTLFTLFPPNGAIALAVSSITTGFVDGTGLHMAGFGTLYAANYDPTFASFILNSSDSGDAVTFQATTTAMAPEPASLALFGTGLLGIVGMARRKFNV